MPVGSEIQNPKMEIKVLLVDDEKEFVEHLVQRLNLRGLSAEVVYDGSQAVEFVRTHKVDVMVLDQSMPGIDGIETLKEIKEISPSTQVILLTGYGSVKKAKEAKELGAAEYLIKPYDTVQLAALIKDIYEKKAQPVVETDNE